MQTLRKKNSPCKFKNAPTRFLGEGVSFKAKLIGILEVSEARGDRMCQAALADLKMAIRAAGEHKQRIAVQVSIDGLRLRDEKSGDCLYHHPVHKISFIAQDMSDSRAFGYIFGSPNTGHRFFGIKTDKAASQVVIAMRDLFQVVFELKKKEIELTKRQLEQNALNAIKFNSNFIPTRIFVEPTPDTKGAAGSEILDGRGNTNTELMKALKVTEKRNDSQSGVIADLLDLQFELNSLQQGIHHMDKINPENAPPSADDLFETDPFGDSFANMKLEDTVRPILPPPPSSKRGHLERQQTVPGAQSSVTSSPATTSTSKTPPLPSSIQWFDKEAENLFSDSELSSSAKNTPVKKEAEETQAKSPQIDVFTELDPLGTGLIKPYVDKKDFFQHLKNPPKKVLKDLVSTSSDTFQTNFDALSEPLDSGIARSDPAPKEAQFDDGNFANFDKFDENEAVQAVFTRSDSSKRTETSTRPAHHQPLSVSLPPEDSATSASSVPLVTRIEKDSTEQGPVKLPSPIKSTRKKELEIDLAKPMDKSFPVDFSTVNESPSSPHKCCSPEIMCVCRSVAAEFDPVPERPPRGASSILINPPPLPPKKQGNRGALKPPPRPPHTDTYFHYDFPEREKDRSKSPPKEVKSQFDDNFSPPVQIAEKSDLIGAMATTASAFEDSFSSIMPTADISTFFSATSTPMGQKKPKPSLDITLSQLTSANLNELANSLGITVQELTSLTLQQLTECLAKLANKEVPVSDTEESEQKVQTKTSTSDFQPFSTMNEQDSKQDVTYDKYAVFRELLELEQMERNEESTTKDSMEEETSSVSKEEFEVTTQQQESGDESRSETLASLVNLTVNLPPSNEDLTKEESTEKPEETSVSSSIFEKTQLTESESKSELTEPSKPEPETDTTMKKTVDIESETEKKVTETDEKTEETESTEKPSDSNEESDKTIQETTSEETSAPSTIEKTPSVSMSSDRYAALREIIGEPEPSKQTEEESPSSRMSPIIQPPQTKASVEVELLNLFADTPPSSSPKKTKKEEETKSMGLDIFEEIERLSSGSSTKKTKSLIPEDIFCPFTELKPDDGKDDGNWAKFDTGLFVTDRPGEDPHSISGTSPWSPDGKEFHKEGPYKGVYRQSGGDSDNEWKDEEESEESNGRVRDGRFWCSRHSRFDVPFDERGFYEEAGGPGGKRERSFRHRMMEKPRDAAWIKNPDHRPRDPSPWHEESQWEQEPKRYPHRKMPYKDEEEQYEAHWKCRPKPQRWNWSHEHRPFYDDERKRKMMLWKEDRFGSQESMGYEDEDRMRPRRKYDRRRWEEDARFWSRRTAPESDYPSRESYYYYREGRERPHDYPPPGWDEEYGSDRPADDSPRYNQPGRKRHWPKRPNSANEGRNVEIGYAESRSKFGTSRSECSDNDSDPYPRSSQRSRSRESYWSSDQEYDSWVERPYWSEGPDAKSESLHQKRMPRKPRQPHAKTQSPFEDDFAQSAEHVEPVEPIAAEPRVRSEPGEQKPPPQSPSFTARYPKGSRGATRAAPADEIYGKRSSYFEDDLTPSASGLSDTSDRQRLSWELKATPEELPGDTKEAHQPADSFAPEDNGRDSFFNGDLRYDDDDAFAFKSELEDNVSEHRATTLPLKNHGRQGKYPAGGNNNNNNKSRGDQYIRKSESVNIFVRENDPFDDDDFFN